MPVGDSCAEIIHLVRAARNRGIGAHEPGPGSKSDLLKPPPGYQNTTQKAVGRYAAALARLSAIDFQQIVQLSELRGHSVESLVVFDVSGSPAQLSSIPRRISSVCSFGSYVARKVTLGQETELPAQHR
jgi:hypothetical protein